MKLSELAAEVIRLGAAIHCYWDRELPSRHPNYPLIHAGEDTGPTPPEEEQLRDFLRGLPASQVFALVLLMYIGRGDYGTDDLGESYNAVKETFERPEFAIEQMISKTALDEYLTDGLAEVKKSHIDLDAIAFEAAGAPAHP